MRRTEGVYLGISWARRVAQKLRRRAAPWPDSERGRRKALERNPHHDPRVAAALALAYWESARDEWERLSRDKTELRAESRIRPSASNRRVCS